MDYSKKTPTGLRPSWSGCWADPPPHPGAPERPLALGGSSMPAPAPAKSSALVKAVRRAECVAAAVAMT